MALAYLQNKLDISVPVKPILILQIASLFNIMVGCKLFAAPRRGKIITASRRSDNSGANRVCPLLDQPSNVHAIVKYTFSFSAVKKVTKL